MIARREEQSVLDTKTQFEVHLSRDDEARDPAAPGEIAPIPVGSRKTILIVEDEEAVRELASQFLMSAGHTVLSAKDGAEALAIAQNQRSQFICLLQMW